MLVDIGGDLADGGVVGAFEVVDGPVEVAICGVEGASWYS